MSNVSSVKAKSMSRIISITSGLALASLLGFAAIAIGPARAAEPEGDMQPERQGWSFSGPLGGYDQGQLQRGFKIYREVCANCHSLNLISFRNFGDRGGPAFSEGQVKALAAEYKIKDLNDAGEAIERPGRPSDAFPWAYANPQAAAATLGVAPPDMSLLAKARSYERGFPWFVLDMLPFSSYQEKGPDYIYSLLVKGYVEPPKGMDMPAGSNYNAIYPGHRIAMANPLNLMFDEKTNKPSDPGYYTDGTPFTREQAARDVTSFLMWAADPKLEERKQIGLTVTVFLAIFAGLLYLVKKKIWGRLESDPYPSM